MVRKHNIISIIIIVIVILTTILDVSEVGT